MFKQIQIFLRICPFSKLLRKTNSLSISVLLSVIVNFFWLKMEFFSEFHQKCFKTTEKHILAVCGRSWREKKFLSTFIQFNYFEQKGLFKEYPNFPQDLLLFKLVENNKLSDYFWPSFWDVTFLNKIFFQWIPPKMLQNNRKA